MKHSPGFLKVVAAAKRRVREVTVAEVREKLRRKHPFILVDVREDNEWKKGRIPGSIHLGKGVIERDIELAVPGKKEEIVLYCGGGYRSVLAADMLQTMGYRKVTSLAGGWKEWNRARKRTAG
jgi:rhodanese-related sulfurtransferase